MSKKPEPKKPVQPELPAEQQPPQEEPEEVSRPMAFKPPTMEEQVEAMKLRIAELEKLAPALVFMYKQHYRKDPAAPGAPGGANG